MKASELSPAFAGQVKLEELQYYPANAGVEAVVLFGTNAWRHDFHGNIHICTERVKQRVAREPSREMVWVYGVTRCDDTDMLVYARTVGQTSNLPAEVTSETPLEEIVSVTRVTIEPD